MRTITVTSRRGTKTVQTDRSDFEAVGALDALLVQREGGHDFARDLVAKFYGRGLSDKQMAWVHVLLHEMEQPPAPQRDAVDLHGERIIALFDAAVEHLKYPKVQFEDVPDVGTVRFSRAGDRSRNPGAVNVTDDEPYNERCYYGRINRDGTYTPGHRHTEAVLTFLREFAQEPAGLAAEAGIASGHCCFCRKRLTDERSMLVGYGAKCASHWHLPWGERPAGD